MLEDADRTGKKRGLSEPPSVDRPAKRGRSDPDQQAQQRARVASPLPEQGEEELVHLTPPLLAQAYRTPYLAIVAEEFRANIFEQLLDPNDIVGTLKNITSWAAASNRLKDTQYSIVDAKKMGEIRAVATAAVKIYGSFRYGKMITVDGEEHVYPDDSDTDSLPFRDRAERKKTVSEILSLGSAQFSPGVYRGLIANLDYVPTDHIPEIADRVLQYHQRQNDMLERQRRSGAHFIEREGDLHRPNWDLTVALIEKAELLDQDRLRKLIETCIKDASHNPELVDAWAPKMDLVESQDHQVEIIDRIAQGTWPGRRLMDLSEHVEKLQPLGHAELAAHVLLLPDSEANAHGNVSSFKCRALCNLAKHLPCMDEYWRREIVTHALALPARDPYKPKALCNLVKNLSCIDEDLQRDVVKAALEAVPDARYARNRVSHKVTANKNIGAYDDPHFRAVESLHYMAGQRTALTEEESAAVDRKIRQYTQNGPEWSKALLIDHLDDRDAFLASALKMYQSSDYSTMMALTVRVDELKPKEKIDYKDCADNWPHWSAGYCDFRRYNALNNLPHFAKSEQNYWLGSHIDHIKDNRHWLSKYYPKMVENAKSISHEDIEKISASARKTIQDEINDFTRDGQIRAELKQSGPSYENARTHGRIAVRIAAEWCKSALREAMDLASAARSTLQADLNETRVEAAAAAPAVLPGSHITAAATEDRNLRPSRMRGLMTRDVHPAR